MYLAHYKLAEKPFQINTDPGFLWLGETHKEALAVLKYGVMSRNGILAVTGDAGTGKSTLIKALLEDLDDDIIVANLVHTKIDLLGFLNLVAQSFHMPGHFNRLGGFILHFTRFLKNQYHGNSHVLLIVDEAHQLSPEILEQIRLLSNIEVAGENLISIFLVGQNELNQKLLSRECRALRQRITIHYQLKPLLHSETLQYCNHRLKSAGSRSEIFDRQAISKIHRFSGGYPRLINIICERALIAGYAKGVSKISSEIIRECARELLLPGEAKIKLEPELASALASAYHSVADLSLKAKTRTFYSQLEKQAKQLRVCFVDRYISGPLLRLPKSVAGKFRAVGAAIGKPVGKRTSGDSIRENDGGFFRKHNLKQEIHPFFSKLFKSGLANTALGFGSFSLALLFSLWYQGVLPFNGDFERPGSPAMQAGGPTEGESRQRVDAYGADVEEDSFLAVESSVNQTTIESGASGIRVEIPAKGFLAQTIDQRAKKETDKPKAAQQAEPPGIQTTESRPFAAQVKDKPVRRDKEKSKSLRGFSDRVSATYALQVGAFLYEKNASTRLDLLAEKGYPANIVQFIDGRGRNWYTVRLGDYPSLRVAKKQAEDFSAREKLDSIVRPVNRF